VSSPFISPSSAHPLVRFLLLCTLYDFLDTRKKLLEGYVCISFSFLYSHLSASTWGSLGTLNNSVMPIQKSMRKSHLSYKPGHLYLLFHLFCFSSFTLKTRRYQMGCYVLCYFSVFREVNFFWTKAKNYRKHNIVRTHVGFCNYASHMPVFRRAGIIFTLIALIITF
jgi:hypothetical protein